MSRLHREILKQELFNHDYSNTKVNRMILLNLHNNKITVEDEGPQGFTHWGFSSCELSRLVDEMNKQVDKHPDFDLIIVDEK